MQLGVNPKVLNFNVPNTHATDARAIRKRLHRSAINKRIKENNKLKADIDTLSKEIRNCISGVEWYLLYKAIQKNIKGKRNKIIKTHEDKLSNLSHNKVLPFTHDEVVRNLWSYSTTEEELDMLKFGLSFAIPPTRLNKTSIYTTFDMINRFFCNELSIKDNDSVLKAELSQLANWYYSNYRPLASTLKKHKILKKLRKNENIVIMRPDKRNGVVIMDKSVYVEKMLELLSDRTKFKCLKDDPIILREGQYTFLVLSSKTDFRFEFLVIYAGNFSLIQ